MSINPKIIAFCCNWCSYAAADLAGTKRLQYPHQVRIIRVMCSGMVHPENVFEALQGGADAVMLIGCHLGECHYQKGNYLARERAELIWDMMVESGLDRRRFVLDWVSSAEPDRFARLVTKTFKEIALLSTED